MIAIILGICMFVSIALSYLALQSYDNTSKEMIGMIHFTNAIVLLAILALFIYQNITENGHDYIFILIFMVYGTLFMTFVEIYQHRNNRTSIKAINIVVIIVQIAMFLLLLYLQYEKYLYYKLSAKDKKDKSAQITTMMQLQMQQQRGLQPAQAQLANIPPNLSGQTPRTLQQQAAVNPSATKSTNKAPQIPTINLNLTDLKQAKKQSELPSIIEGNVAE